MEQYKDYLLHMRAVHQGLAALIEELADISRSLTPVIDFNKRICSEAGWAATRQVWIPASLEITANGIPRSIPNIYR
jgi:hypothetical protein